VKYDEKTGEKKPECRMDEIKLSLEQLNNLQKKTNGMVGLENENNLLLKDISVSLGLVVDILGTMYNKMFAKEENIPKQ
jgi:hypothetical protein